MNRDMDLVRKILLALEEHADGFAPSDLQIDGYTKEQVGFHVLLMGEANLLKVFDSTTFDSTSPQGMAGRLTWDGYEFLDAAREPSRWTAAMKKITESGAGMTFEILKGVLVALSTQALKGQ